MEKRTCSFDIHRVRDGKTEAVSDVTAVEEPLEIRVNGKAFTVTMRTPGDDADLAAGLLFTEGVIRSAADLGEVEYCPDTSVTDRENVLEVTLKPGVKFDPERWRRAHPTTSACGVCGKRTIKEVRRRAAPLAGKGPELDPALLTALPERLIERQSVFSQTGGLHAAALLDAAGKPVALKEDIGRHNTVDKIAGHQLFRNALPLTDRILLVSGRAGFEIVQKAWIAGIPVLCAIGAPSSLAVETAREAGMTLVGFLKSSGYNVYSGNERMTGDRS